MTDVTFDPEVDDAAPPGEGANEVATRDGGRLPEGAVPGHPGVSAVWQEGTPGHSVIRLSGLPGAPPGQEVVLGRAGANNHSPSISDQSSAEGHVSRISIAWIESPAGDTSGVGRVMLQRLSAGTVGKAIDATALAVAANDNATWVTDSGGTGATGSEPTVAELVTGDTLVAWLGADGHAHGRLYAPLDATPRAGDNADGAELAAVNAALGDLGSAAAASDAGRRLQAAELRPGTFAVMWLALADNGPVLRGSLYVAPVHGEGNELRGGDWTEHPISEFRLPHGFAGQFSMAAGGEDGQDLVVTYSLAGGKSGVGVVAHFAETAWADGGEEQPNGEHFPEFGARIGGAPSDLPPHPDDLAQPHLLEAAKPVQAALQKPDPAVPAAATFAVAADPAAKETAPIVTAVDGGFAVAWQTPGAGDAVQAVQIKLMLYDERGIAKGPAIPVTDNAASDVAPAVSGLGDGVAAAYVHADDHALVVKAYDGDGDQLGEETVVDAGDAGAIVEVAIASNDEDELAVVYVQQASDAGEGTAGYGNIMLQRFAVETEGGQSQLVELGRDGEQDGADAPVQLAVATDDPDVTEPAVGRAPAVAGVDDGELAIIWVANDGARETIAGCVLDDDGGQVLRIDLTALLENAGIAKGTKPQLLDAGDGGFLVSWLQHDGGDGGFVVMAALYSEVSAGAWLAPEHAIRLKAFDSEPKDYSVAVSSDDDGLFIDVTWRQDGSGSGGGDKVLSQRYDLDGERLGGATKVAQDDAMGDLLAGNTLAAAGLVDGQIVVVYAEQGANGDLDLAAHIIDTSASNETGGFGETAGTSDATGGNTFSTGVDQETTIDVLGNATGAGLTITHINDIPITTATPVDVGSGWVQLREDGYLTVNPDAGYTGQIAFDCTVAGAAGGAEAKSRVVVNVETVEADDAATAVTLRNQVTTVAEDVPVADDLKVADLALADGELSLDGLSLTGLDAGMFKIVGSALYLKAGVELDFETKPTLSVEILANGDSGPDGVASFALSVGSAAGEPDATNDTFEFVTDYAGGGAEREAVDLSSTGYTTFQELLGSGALAQAGDDVVITLNPDDAADAHKIILKGAELSALSASDFKFS